MVEAINRLLEVPSTDPDDARRGKLLNILLVGVAVIMLLTLSTMFIFGTLNPDHLGRSYTLSLASSIILIGILIIFAINRYGSGILASSLFLLLLTIAIAFADEPEQVVNGRSLFLFTIPILMSSVILRPWASFILAGLSDLIIAVIALGLPGYVPPVPTMLGLFAFAIISWLSARSLENALKDLRALNRELDQRVEVRTRELREANLQLAEANERLQELDRLKSRFVSMVSHELRTPIGAIQGFTEMLQAEIFGPISDKQENALKRIRVNTQQLLHIVSDLLDQARIEAGQLSLDFVPFNPVDLIDDMRSTMGVMAESKGLVLTADVSPDVPDKLYGDPKRLHQILVNLVNNAIKFTEEGGVHVRVYQSDGFSPAHWSIEVSDTGPGIPEKAQKYIFEPFRRVDDSNTREHLGVGLGLSIVQQLVDLMDGEIVLESEVGHGSTFTVTLPSFPKEEVL